jgi:hypothetical protein
MVFDSNAEAEFSLSIISSVSATPPSKELSTSLVKDIAAFHLLRRMRILFGRPESYESFSSLTFSKVIGQFFAKDLCQVAETVPSHVDITINSPRKRWYSHLC